MTARLLLDSHVLLWWSGHRSKLSQSVVDAIVGADEALLSIVTPWELELKKATGKLVFPAQLWEQIAEHGLSLLSIELPDALAAARLPMHHRDPFDRMIIAQALRHSLTVVTRDPIFASYGIPILTA